MPRLAWDCSTEALENTTCEGEDRSQPWGGSVGIPDALTGGLKGFCASRRWSFPDPFGGLDTGTRKTTVALPRLIARELAPLV